ncbi:MAG: hypothetical protein LBK00_00305 [Treponema sp.]|jgi:hypothetical protein|nr:hypothetical protein [Treponema sp.]
MSIERAYYYENLRRSSYRNEKEAFSLSLERAYEGNKPDPYQSDPAVRAVEADLHKAFDAGDMRWYGRLLDISYKTKAAIWRRLQRETESEKTAQAATTPVMETTTPPTLTTEMARPEAKPAPLVERRPISAIRTEVYLVANELRESAGMSKSMVMRESWAMAKSGRAVSPVKRASFI